MGRHAVGGIDEGPQHFVQFYESDEFLAGAIADFAGRGLAGGTPVAIIASGAHRAAAAERLCERGLGRGAGTILFLDADEVLAEVLVDERPDWERFRAVVGGALDELARASDTGRILAYGEMVDILWRRGNAPAALSLEAMWSTLQEFQDFTLLCSYDLEALGEDTSGLRRVCEHHTRVYAVESGRAPSGTCALIGEIERRIEVERSFRESLHELGEKEAEQRRLAEARDASQRRTEQLGRITRAIADAVSDQEVYEAVVDELGEAVGATSAGLWLVSEDRPPELVRCRGYSEAVCGVVESTSIDAGSLFPALDAIRSGETIWISSHEQLPEGWPHLAHLCPDSSAHRVCCLPLAVERRILGCLAFSFNAPVIDGEEEAFLLLAARYSGQALERLRLLELEQRARTRAESAMAELENSVRFTGVLGHDLRNPLSAMMTAAQLALAKDGGGSFAKPLTRIIGSGQRMARMIDQLLDLTRVRAGTGFPLAPRPISLVPVVTQVMNELDEAHPRWTLTLEHEGDATGTWDADRLSQVFSNLVGNAVQHGQVDHGVRVRIDGEAAETVRVDVHNMGAVPESLMPRIFDPLAYGTRREGQPLGLGLGLCICREIVKAHGGRVEVRSEQRLGTTFTVWLPRSTGAD